MFLSRPSRDHIDANCFQSKDKMCISPSQHEVFIAQRNNGRPYTQTDISQYQPSFTLPPNQPFRRPNNAYPAHPPPNLPPRPPHRPPRHNPILPTPNPPKNSNPLRPPRRPHPINPIPPRNPHLLAHAPSPLDPQIIHPARQHLLRRRRFDQRSRLPG